MPAAMDQHEPSQPGGAVRPDAARLEHAALLLPQPRPTLSPTASNASSDSATSTGVVVVPVAGASPKTAAEAPAVAGDGEIEECASSGGTPFSPRVHSAKAVAMAARRRPRLFLSHEHPAIVAALSKMAAETGPGGAAARSWPRRTRDWLVMPLALPLLGALWLLALLAALAMALAVWPSVALARRLYWACPFIPCIWAGPARERWGCLGAQLLRLQFEGAHCATIVGRLLTLPMRPHLPSFYIAGFPKCGTTSLAAYVRSHPGISGIDGMPGHEALSKESHFFCGMLGGGGAASSSAVLYRSFFPTVVTRWWHEAVLGAPRWQCFDATPTYACLPHVPARVAALTPGAKVVFMVREPTAAVFSAETMLRGMGVPLDWTMARLQAARTAPGAAGRGVAAAAAAAAVAAAAVSRGAGYVDVEAGPAWSAAGGLLRDDPAHDELWRRLAALPPGAPLPPGLPAAFYRHPLSYVRGAQYADRLAEWAAHLPTDNLMVVDFQRFVEQPEAVVREVLAFVGADLTRYRFSRLPPAMRGDYRGAKADPAVRRAVAARWFSRSNAELAAMLGTDLGWNAALGAAAG